MKKKMTFEHLHNKKLVTRREMLAAGLIPFAARVTLPALGALLTRNATADELICKAAAASDLCPVVLLNLSGGASLPSNYIVHTKELELMPTYSKLGLGSGAGLRISQEFGNSVPFSSSSGILSGIRAVTEAGTRAKTSFVGVCLKSQDDSAGNRLDISGIVNRSGYLGKILPNLGRSQTDTGTKLGFAYVKPNPPLAVSRFSDLIGALSVSGSLGKLSQQQKVQMFNSIQNLNITQARKLSSLTGGSLMSGLIQCAGLDNNKIVAADVDSLNLDPIANAAYSDVWGITAATSKNSQDYVFASMVYNAINGNAGAISLEMGGYDYHDNTRTSGDTKDQQAGQVIGRILQSFSLMNRKGFVIVTTDGSTTSEVSDQGGTPWKSDSGNNSVSYLMGFDPFGAHPTKAFQIGGFQNQVVDEKATLGGATELSAAAFYANYMAFNNRTADVEKFLPGVFSTADLNKILMFT